VHMMNVHFADENGTGPVEDGGYQCRHCDSKFPGLSDIKRHLTEEHEVTTGLSMHYLNRFKFCSNEVNLWKLPCIQIQAYCTLVFFSVVVTSYEGSTFVTAANEVYLVETLKIISEE
jgi:hypothetical protein